MSTCNVDALKGRLLLDRSAAQGSTFHFTLPASAAARGSLAARQADVAAAQAQLNWAQRNLGRQRELLEKGFISRNAFDNVQNEEQVARARLDAARAQQAQAAKALADAQLPSPIDGIIATRHAEPGERLPADAPVLTVVSLARLELAANVPTTEIAGVRIGQPVRVRVDGFEGRVFEGRVERINPQATAGAGVVPVYLVVDNADGTLRAGLFAHGELMLSAGAPSVVVPAAALHDEGRERYVFAIEGGRVTKRPVQVAYVASGHAVIAQGIAEGTTVVAVNLGQLPVGAQAVLNGSHWTVDAWHGMFKRVHLGFEIKKEQVAGSKRVRVVRRLRSTKGLKVRAMSVYLEKVMAHAATELGVTFSALKWQEYER